MSKLENTKEVVLFYLLIQVLFPLIYLAMPFEISWFYVHCVFLFLLVNLPCCIISLFIILSLSKVLNSKVTVIQSSLISYTVPIVFSWLSIDRPMFWGLGSDGTDKSNYYGDILFSISETVAFFICLLVFVIREKSIVKK